jgi:hypothetical protein
VTTDSASPGPVSIPACRRWTQTGVMLRKGHTYRITARGSWQDKDTSCGPGGYASKSLVLRLAEPLRRKWHANWFVLIGAQRSLFARSFVISDGVTYRALRDGKLWCFANDAWFMYFNNKGSVARCPGGYGWRPGNGCGGSRSLHQGSAAR